jgi:hypothetical protein
MFLLQFRASHRVQLSVSGNSQNEYTMYILLQMYLIHADIPTYQIKKKSISVCYYRGKKSIAGLVVKQFNNSVLVLCTRHITINVIVILILIFEGIIAVWIRCR